MKSKDPLADAFRAVRDATVNTPELSNADRIAVLELVKHEILTDGLADLKKAALNG